MSALGTGVAAGVAQTARRAQRLGRAADLVEAQRSHATREQRHLFQTRLHAPGGSTGADGDAPDHPPPGYEALYKDSQDGSDDASGEDAAASSRESSEDAAATQSVNADPDPHAFDPDQMHLYTVHGEQPPTPIHHLDLEA